MDPLNSVLMTFKKKLFCLSGFRLNENKAQFNQTFIQNE